MGSFTQVGACTIVQGDCLDTLRLLPENSVPMICTSPPYDKLRDYKGFTFDFENIAREMHRVMVPGGVVCWVVGDSVVNGSETLTSCKQKIFFVEQCGFRCHDTMIYEKLNPGNPSDSQLRYNQSIEYIFVLSKGKPGAWNPIKDKPNVSFGKTRFGNKARKGKGGVLDGTSMPRMPAAEFGLRGNCWLGPTAGQERPCQKVPHPAQMPEWLAGDLILSWSNPGDLVVDICAGGGTVAKMANKYGRPSLMMELSEEYCGLIAQRVASA